jgi:hypothetical protein
MINLKRICLFPMIGISIVLYAIVVIVIFFVLLIRYKLNFKVLCTPVPNQDVNFNEKRNYIKRSINSGYISQYFQYVIRGYSEIVWGENSVTDAIKHYGYSQHKTRHYQIEKDICDLPKIPLKEKIPDDIPDSLHADDSSTGTGGNQPKENLTK